MIFTPAVPARCRGFKSEGKETMKQITAILLGAGNRGAEAHAAYALQFPAELKIVAVAEPREDRRAHLAKEHGISPQNAVDSWETLLEREKFADCVLICTPDRLHYPAAMAALKRGYDVLCEKPMGCTFQQVLELKETAERLERILCVCHVLRYTVHITKLKELLDAGTIGKLVNVHHIESISYWHMAHSFVRGNWRNDTESSPLILQKCCHDMDILSWLIDSSCTHVSSFGNLFHFKAENRPDGASDRCLDNCSAAKDCPYYAPRFYLEHPRAKRDGFDRIVSMDTSPSGILNALKTGPYGRCVYACDNNVPDHQVVNLLFENGVTVGLTVSAFSEKYERVMNFMGTHGQIIVNMEEPAIHIWKYASGEHTVIPIEVPAGGHRGGDPAMMRDFLKMLRQGDRESRISAEQSLEGHLIALAAEESRLRNGNVIDMKRWKSRL